MTAVLPAPQVSMPIGVHPSSSEPILSSQSAATCYKPSTSTSTTRGSEAFDGDHIANAQNNNMKVVPLTHANTERRVRSSNSKRPALERATSCPEIKYDDCREFDSFAGEWTDSKGQTVLISPWGVIRYPNNPKLRFEAVYMGPNHLSVTFDKDPKKRKFVGKLNHDCELLIWSNDTKWVKKASKHDPRFHQKKKGSNSRKTRNGSCSIQ
eukprot:386549_1